MTTRATELLRVAHARPGVTRADAARLLGVGTGAATELVTRLAQSSLLAEAPAAPRGTRGRPTTVLVPHPAGPLVLAAAVTHAAWRIDVVELGGHTLTSAQGRHAGESWAEVSAAVTAAISALRRTYGARLRALGLSLPGTVTPGPRLDANAPGRHDANGPRLDANAPSRHDSDPPGPPLDANAPSRHDSDPPGPRLDASGLGWHGADLAGLWPDPALFVAGNDATLAASAESSRGAAVGATVALHVRIEGGLGGAVVDHGRVLVGAHGAGGEFGHLPFGDPAVPCGCGASGCWQSAVDGTALARLLGHPEPRDPVGYARRVIAATTAPERAAVRTVAAALGRGLAGLVNGLDPDLVTLGGVGTDLLAAARPEIETAYRTGLMSVRRATPPPLLPAALGDDGPIAGAGEEAWSRLLLRL